MKRYLYLIALIFIFLSGCDKETPPSNKVKIEWEYPHYYSKKSSDEVDDIIELFATRIFLINTVEQLEENPLLVYFTEDVQEQMKGCDFDRYSLIVCSSFSTCEIDKFGHSVYKQDTGYDYYLRVRYTNCSENPIKDIYILGMAFCIKKIPDDSALRYITSAYSE